MLISQIEFSLGLFLIVARSAATELMFPKANKIKVDTNVYIIMYYSLGLFVHNQRIDRIMLSDNTKYDACFLGEKSLIHFHH